MSVGEPSAPWLQRSSTSDEVVALLRERIVSGELEPGTQLREVSLAQAIGVSRPTLREALQVLRQERLVRHVPHRGMFVAAIGREEIAEIYRVRRVIEGSAARACREAEAGSLGEVNEACEEFVSSWGGDQAGAIDADLRFHQAIVGLLGSSMLDAFFDSVVAALRPCLVLLAREVPDSVLRPGTIAEHEAIAAAIAARDRRRAERLVTAHIDANRELLLEVVGAGTE